MRAVNPNMPENEANVLFTPQMFQNQPSTTQTSEQSLIQQAEKLDLNSCSIDNSSNMTGDQTRIKSTNINKDETS